MSVKIIPILLAVVLSSCGSEVDIESCDLFTSGICFRTTKPLKVEDINFMVSLVEEELLRWYPDTPNLPTLFEDSGVIVITTDAYLATSCEQTKGSVYECENWVNGVNSGNVIYIMNRDCLANTALAHELLHTYEWEHLGLEDLSAHRTPHLFEEWLTIDLDATRRDVVETNVLLRYLNEHQTKECKDSWEHWSMYF